MAKKGKMGTGDERALRIRADIILIGERLDPETGLEPISGFSDQARFEREIARVPIGLERIRCRRLRAYIA